MAPLCPPAGVPAGELVTFEGHARSPVEAGNRAGKAWKKASKTLVVNDDNVSRVVSALLLDEPTYSRSVVQKEIGWLDVL